MYPTLCDLARLPLPDHLEGDSFVPLLDDQKREWKRAAFSRYHAGDSVRTERYLYTEWHDGDGGSPRACFTTTKATPTRMSTEPRTPATRRVSTR